MNAAPNPAAPAEATPDPIAELRRDFDARLDTVRHNIIEEIIFWAGHEFAKLWAENAELRAELAALKKADTDPGLDVTPPRGGPLKRVCQVVGSTGYSETRLRTWARSGVINSKYVGGRLFIDERDVPVKKRKSG